MLTKIIISYPVKGRHCGFQQKVDGLECRRDRLICVLGSWGTRHHQESLPSRSPIPNPTGAINRSLHSFLWERERAIQHAFQVKSYIEDGHSFSYLIP